MLWLLSWKECDVCYMESRTSEDKKFHCNLFPWCWSESWYLKWKETPKEISLFPCHVTLGAISRRKGDNNEVKSIARDEKKPEFLLKIEYSNKWDK